MSNHKFIRFSRGSLLRTAIPGICKERGSFRQSGSSWFLRNIRKHTFLGLALTVLVLAGNPMQFGAIASESSLDSNNNAKLPEISIRSVSSPVSEGQNADFAVNTNRKGRDELIVNVRVAQQGNHILMWAPAKIRIPADSNSVIYSLQTEDDSLDEPNGAVIATLVNGDGYLLASESSATVEVLDNDSESESAEGSKLKVTVAGAVTRQILLESGYPKITISPVKKRIAKGQEAVFSLSADPAPMQDLDIELEISSSGSKADVFPMTVSLSANHGSLLVPLDLDRIADSDSITVSVSEGEGFRPGTPSEATVTIEK